MKEIFQHHRSKHRSLVCDLHLCFVMQFIEILSQIRASRRLVDLHFSIEININIELIFTRNFTYMFLV